MIQNWLVLERFGVDEVFGRNDVDVEFDVVVASVK